MAGMPVVRLHLYEAAFEVWTIEDGGPLPLVFLRRFPLALYILWVTCRVSYLGHRFETLHQRAWSLEYWYLASPLSLPHSILEHGPRLKVYCLDFCLGHVEVARVLQDLLDFFQCQVFSSV